MVKPSFEAETPSAPVKIKAAAARINPKHLIVFIMVRSIFYLCAAIKSCLNIFSAAPAVPYNFSATDISGGGWLLIEPESQQDPGRASSGCPVKEMGVVERRRTLGSHHTCAGVGRGGGSKAKRGASLNGQPPYGLC
jgi:hypothetical protein